MEPRLARLALEQLLFSSAKALESALAEQWLNELIPDLRSMIGCDQGTNKHVEGDVAEHTILVFENFLEVTRRRLNREASFVERLAVLLHDLRKPAVRVEAGNGSVHFPGHEALAAREVPEIAARIGLNDEEAGQLHFLVARHGDAYYWPELSPPVKEELRASPYFDSLALLQEADALSCLFPDGSHLSVHWSQMIGGSSDE